MAPNASQKRSLFDRFAELASEFASHAALFIGCVALVLIWAPSYFVFRSTDTWQLVINTATTIVTFLLVALLRTRSAEVTKLFTRSSTRSRTGLPT